MAFGHEPSTSTSPLRAAAARWRRTGAAATLVGLVAISLAGCTGDDSPQTPNGDEPSAASAPTTVPGVVSPKLPKVPDLEDSTGVVKDAKMTDCTTEPGKVAADGTVTNSADKTKDIVIVISWVTPTSDVVARAVTAIEKLKPGKTSDWTASSSLKFDGSAQCVMTVNAGTLKS